MFPDQKLGSGRVVLEPAQGSCGIQAVLFGDEPDQGPRLLGASGAAGQVGAHRRMVVVGVESRASAYLSTRWKQSSQDRYGSVSRVRLRAACALSGVLAWVMRCLPGGLVWAHGELGVAMGERILAASSGGHPRSTSWSRAWTSTADVDASRSASSWGKPDSSNRHSRQVMTSTGGPSTQHRMQGAR